MRAVAVTMRALDAQRGALFPWAPVFFGTGIGGYFAIASEPEPLHWVVWAATIVLSGVCLLRLGQRAPLLIALFLVLCGFGSAALRTHMVAGPVLPFRYYGPIEGRVLLIDRSASDKVRLTLDQVTLSGMTPEETPRRVRISLHGEQGYIEPVPGLRIVMTGHLDAPGGPVEPGGFDFQRQAWFGSLGAVGYTRTPVLSLASADEGRAGLFVHRIRMAMSAAVQETLPGRNGAFAAAITTGDRSGMDTDTLESLRISNLAHLLAISGLHMGLLTGFVYAVSRYGLALIPMLALRIPTHKIGACIALVAGAIYLALSGGNVATERAYVMVAVMFLAVLFDRRALTLRAVALAALIVLMLRPEALMGPGFQMSFAATAALIAVFQGLRETGMWRWHPVLRWAAALVISSAVAGLGTAPFAAAHFNRIPHYGLVANLLSVPVMGGLVMPAAVLSAVLAPLGLDWIGLRIMEPGIAWILNVSDRVAALEGAASHVVMPQPYVLPVLTMGALFTIIWTGRARLWGCVPVLFALIFWTQQVRPTLLISADGGLLGLQAGGGRALSKPKGAGFAASSWLENDGDGQDQIAAAARPGFTGDKRESYFDLGTASAAHFTGRGADLRAKAACDSVSLVIVTAEIGDIDGPCLMIDRVLLTMTGALAIDVVDDVLRITPAQKGGRPWNRPARPKTQTPTRAVQYVRISPTSLP